MIVSGGIIRAASRIASRNNLAYARQRLRRRRRRRRRGGGFQRPRRRQRCDTGKATTSKFRFARSERHPSTDTVKGNLWSDATMRHVSRDEKYKVMKI